MAEIYRGIEAADSFLFIISLDSVASEICTFEIEHAVKHNKRLVPVIWKDADDVHQSMSAHNWVFLRQEDDFEANFELLIDALDTDLAYIREHTRLLTRAIEWHDNNRRRTDVLRGPELTAAEGWLSISQSMEPQSTELHDDYITFSRATVNRFQRLIISGVTVAFVLVLGLAAFSFYKSNQSEERRKEADSQRQLAEKTTRIATAQSLSAFALAEMETDPELSLLLATKSIRTLHDTNETVLPLSNTVLRQSIIKSRVRLTLKGHGDYVWSAVYSADGERIVTASEDKTAKVWDASLTGNPSTSNRLFILGIHLRAVFSNSLGSIIYELYKTSYEPQSKKVCNMMTKKLDHPDFLTLDRMIYDPNRMVITRKERSLLRKKGLDIPPMGKVVIEGEVIETGGYGCRVPIGLELALPEGLEDEAREFGVIPHLPSERQRKYGFQDEGYRFEYHFNLRNEDHKTGARHPNYRENHPERKMCESMINDYPDDFYMYENYIIFLKWLHRNPYPSSEGGIEKEIQYDENFKVIYAAGKHLDPHLDQFDDDLKDEILAYYSEYQFIEPIQSSHSGPRKKKKAEKEVLADLTPFMK